MPDINNISMNAVQSWLKPRPLDAHKGLFGHVLVVGGDYGMPGAVRLVAEGAARIGAGLVTVVTRKAHVVAIVSGRPEILCYGVESSLAILDSLLASATVVALGSGLGHSTWSTQLYSKIMSSSLPIILDADGLNCLANEAQRLPYRPNWVLTPHPGEAARLLGISTHEVQAAREQTVVALQQRYGGVIVLKGAGTLVATIAEPIQRCVAGNPGMATAGMGDLLGGMIAGLVAQGLSLWHAAQAGVLLHAAAGDRAKDKLGERGLLASDLLPELRELLK